MPALRLVAVSKRFAGSGVDAVASLSLDMPEGTITALVGPSGCGKTTTLRMINRLIEPTSGVIELFGTDVRALPVHELRRRTGYVIQQAGLFPHRTVATNIATVPQLLGWDKHRIEVRVAELAELVGLDHELLDRYPSALSGGQQQRVGVARALAADPPLLLMDEPYSAVDPIVRAHLQDELLALQSRVGKTIVFVTHDIDEALKLADQVAVLNVGGVLEQFDTPDELLRAPSNEFVARFLGQERALRRLALQRVDAGDMGDVPEGDESLPSVSASAPLREALDALVAWGAELVVVRDDEGRAIGSLDMTAITDRIGNAPTIGEATVNADSFIWWDWVGRHTEDIKEATWEHLRLTIIAVVVGFVISMVLSLFALRWRAARLLVTSFSGVLYTIPSLALFAFFVSITGFTTLTAEIGLVSYTLLILIRNILEGIEGVPRSVREAADGMGFGRVRRFATVELPLALPAIFAGLRIATVTTVGLVTVTGLIGMGGYGSFIDSGLNRLFSTEVVVGAALSVIMALVLDGLLVSLEWVITPWRHKGRRRATRPAGWQPEMPAVAP